MILDIEPLKKALSETDLPIYECIINTARELIISGKWEKNDRLPTDRELAAELGISHITLAKALNELRRLGMLSRRRSQGTFVNELPQNSISGKIKKIGVVFDVANEHTFHTKFFLAIYRELENAGMSMQFFAADNSAEKQLLLVKQIINDPDMSGCIFWSILDDDKLAELMQCRPVNFPLIVLDKYSGKIRHDSVVFNNFECGVKIGEELKKYNISEIFVYDDTVKHFSSVRDRMDGIAQGCGCSDFHWMNYSEKLENSAGRKPFAIVFVGGFCMREKMQLPDSCIPVLFSVDTVPLLDHSGIVCCFDSSDMARRAVAMLCARLNGDDSDVLQYFSNGMISTVKPL